MLIQDFIVELRLNSAKRYITPSAFIVVQGGVIEMEQKQVKIVRWKDGHKCPDNLTGHIIVFNEPLIVRQTVSRKRIEEFEGEEQTFHWEEPTGKIEDCKFMRADGGFGCYSVCAGRMIIGDFFQTIEDIKNNRPFHKGNNKEFPDGFIPELFTKHEKL